MRGKQEEEGKQAQMLNQMRLQQVRTQARRVPVITGVGARDSYSEALHTRVERHTRLETKVGADPS